MQDLREDFDNLSLLTPEARNSVNMKKRFGDRMAKRLSSISKDIRVIRDRLIEIGFSIDDFDMS
jgi:hypothetical protein